MDAFQAATKNAYRYTTTVGKVTTEDLWNLNLEQLDALAVRYDEAVSASPTKSFIKTVNPNDLVIKNKFKVVKSIIDYKLKVIETAQKAAATKAMKNKVMEAIAQKQDGALQEKSLEELQAMLEEANGSES